MTFEDYYVDQSGSGVYQGPLWQEGGAIRGFAGRDYQYGTGLGSFGRTLYRWAKPILQYLGREGLKTGVNIGSDVVAGTDIKQSVSNRARETGSKIVGDAATAIQKKLRGKGMARRRRRGVRRRPKNKRPVIRRKRTVRRRSRRRVKKTLKDIFT